MLFRSEQGVSWWNSRRKIHRQASIDEMTERQRERAFNPAYEPKRTETSLRRAADEVMESELPR